jgi:hypothetical protein
LKAVEAVIEGKVVRNMTLGLFEMSSEIERKRSYSWMAPKPTLIGVFGQPGGPSDVSKADLPPIPALKAGPAKSDIPAEAGTSTSDSSPVPPDEYDDDASGPRSLDVFS